jgi:hypothetical protein
VSPGRRPLIRNLPRATLGYESFAAGLICHLIEDPEVPTACISPTGVLRYNPGFVREHVRTEADLFCLIEEHAQRLHQAGTRILTILLDGGQECEALEPFGEIIHLEQATL